MVKIDGSRPGDRFVTYEKMGWVAWMMMELMGRDQMLAGLQEFIAIYSPSPDYPVLQNLIATLRLHAPDTEAFDAFVDQWFFNVVIPEYRLTDATVQALGTGWRVTATVENVGTGTMPLELAAIRGCASPSWARKLMPTRFPSPTASPARRSRWPPGSRRP
jgi:ABC-2 type transport system permease protein